VLLVYIGGADVSACASEQRQWLLCNRNGHARKPANATRRVP